MTRISSKNSNLDHSARMSDAFVAGPQNPRRSYTDLRHTQILFGALVSIGVISAILFEPNEKPFNSVILASLVILFGCWPLYRWLGARSREAIPVLAIHGLFYAVGFGIAGLMEPGRMFNLNWTTEPERQAALLMALLGLISLYLGYYLIAPIIFGRRPKLHWPLQVRDNAFRPLALIGMPILIVVDLVISRYDLGLIAQIIGSLYSFVFFLLLYALLSNRLTGVQRKFFIIVLLPYQFFVASGLADSHVAGFVVLAVVSGVIYTATRNRVPYYWVVLAIAVFALLQPIKGEFRSIIWVQQIELTLIEKVQVFFSMGLDYYFSEEATEGQRSDKGGRRTFDRINHLMVTAAVIADTPSRQPFLHGESYLPLFTKWIPRFLWLDKPSEDLGNRWARDYGYISHLDFTTSFNLPWLPEMYMNFGVAGVVGISFMVGLLFRFLAINFWHSRVNPSAFAFGLVLGSPFFFVESNLSLMMGKIVISIIALTILCYALARVFPRYFIWK